MINTNNTGDNKSGNTNTVIKPLKIVRWPQWVIFFAILIYGGSYAVLTMYSLTHHNTDLSIKFRSVSPIVMLIPLAGLSVLASIYSAVLNIMRFKRVRKMLAEQEKNRQNSLR